MSNAETSYTYNNFIFDLDRSVVLADAVIASNIEIATQNTKAEEALPRVADTELRAIAQYELTEDQATTAERRQAAADQIPYEVLHSYRTTMIGRLDHRLEEFIAMQHQVDTLRRLQEQRRADAVSVEQLLGHVSTATQRWVDMKAQETEQRITELEGSFGTGEITRLVDGVKKVDDLYHTAAQPWPIPTVRMPQAYPVEAFKLPEESSPVNKPVVVQSDRRIIFSTSPADVPASTIRTAAEVVDPFKIPEHLKTELSVSEKEATLPAAEVQTKGTVAEQIAELLSGNSGEAVTSQELAVHIYGAAAELIRSSRGSKVYISRLTSYLSRPSAVRSVDDKLMAQGLSFQRGQRLIPQPLSNGNILKKRQNLYRGVALDSEEAKGVRTDNPEEVSWFPAASYTPAEVTKTLEIIAAETAQYKGTIAERIGHMLAHNPETVFTTNDLAVVLFGEEEAARRLGHRGSMRANQISSTLRQDASRKLIANILQQQVPPLEFQIGQNAAPAVDAQGVTRKRPRAVYRSVVKGATKLPIAENDTTWPAENSTEE